MKVDLAAAVLCGGRGERLRPLTDYFQKTMIPIGEKRRPVLEYIVRLLAFHGARSITMLAGYKMEEIHDYFKDGTAFGVRMTYSKDRKDGAGSLSALADALRLGSIPSCETLIVYYGDIISNLSITELVKVHRRRKADATLVLSRGYILPVGVAKVSNGQVVAMDEKPWIDINVTMGCMALGPQAMRVASRAGRRGKADLMSDFVPELLRRKMAVRAYYATGLWYDIGTLTNYEKANTELTDGMLSFL